MDKTPHQTLLMFPRIKKTHRKLIIKTNFLNLQKSNSFLTPKKPKKNDELDTYLEETEKMLMASREQLSGLSINKRKKTAEFSFKNKNKRVRTQEGCSICVKEKNIENKNEAKKEGWKSNMRYHGSSVLHKVQSLRESAHRYSKF